MVGDAGAFGKRQVLEGREAVEEVQAMVGDLRAPDELEGFEGAGRGGAAEGFEAAIVEGEGSIQGEGFQGSMAGSEKGEEAGEGEAGRERVAALVVVVVEGDGDFLEGSAVLGYGDQALIGEQRGAVPRRQRR
jgi:hypothetical protein